MDEIISRVTVLQFGESEACLAGNILAHLQKDVTVEKLTEERLADWLE